MRLLARNQRISSIMENLPNKNTNVLCVWNDSAISPDARRQLEGQGVVSGRERAQTIKKIAEEQRRARNNPHGIRIGKNTRAARASQPGRNTKSGQEKRRQIDEMRTYSNTPISGKALKSRKKGYREQVAEMRKAAGEK